jgi:bifunctional non-homologous end joining protein LigD
MPRAARAGSEHPTLIDQPASPSSLPRSLSPMRPRLAAEGFNSPDHLFELKWDGIRALISFDAGGLRVVDRNGGDLLPAVPELRTLRLPEGTLLDGEIIVCDSRGRPSYDLLIGRLGPKASKRGRGPLFVAFDLLYDEGKPLLGIKLEERRRRLLGRGLAQKGLVVPEHLENDGEPFLDVVAEYELEGVVAKRRDGKYVPGTRSADWLKCLVSPRADVVIGGLVLDEARGARALLCGWMNENGALTYAGEAYVPPYLGDWVDSATRTFRHDGSPFLGPFPLRPGMVWLRPKLVAIVDHESIDRGVLVDARFRALRFDGRIDDCRIEEPVDVPEYPPTGGPDGPRLVVLHSLPFRFS